MYKAFLSYTQVKEYLALLVKKDLISYDSITQTYKTTEKGIRLLQFCNELDDMTKASQSQPHRQPSASQ
jgi:predicted transcriptional regulator